MARLSAAAGRKAEREREILEASVRAFSRYGYHGCAIAKVAEEAGVADGTIYLYFRSKEELLVAAFRHVLDRMLVQIDREVSRLADPVAKLRHTLFLHFSFLEADPELAVFLQIQLRQPDPAIRRAIAGPLAEYARRIEAIIEEGKTAGVLRPDVGTRLLRRIYFGAADETVSAWCLRSERGSLRDKAEPLLDVLLNGMRLPKEAR
jgi:TetR/AcrR family fatty acid metabolism transcriptional regulator